MSDDEESVAKPLDVDQPDDPTPSAPVRSIVEIPSECVEEEGSSPNPLPYPVTEEARLRAEAAQKLDDLTARQAEEQIAALQELLAERIMEQKDADEATRREMKEVHGLDWGRQIPKEQILLDRCLGCSPRAGDERSEEGCCSCAQPKEKLKIVSCGDPGKSSDCGGQGLIDSTRENAATNERSPSSRLIVMHSEVRLKYISTGRLSR
ncbi:hypothetical protein FOZ63_008337 [Perkinsus olseni]|uniref:Uncharacterized protein n=1 Tax=Perkinsus olseni TaxID=32597 RepID=A0A7J6UNL5_PEROL|nr:hypothetical protein FOZ63_008337 [Perkinsus olseni]